MDTQVVIWASTGSRRPASSVREVLEDDANAVFCSVITLWEIVTKEAVRKLELDVEMRDWLAEQRIEDSR